ncbi:MAG: mechanosensitive ion channel family protein [Steroidobacteraceae bacterium]
MNTTLSSVEQMRATAIDLALRFGPKLLTALLMLAVGSMVARWLARWLEKALLHVEMEPPVRLLLVRIGRFAVVGLFGIMALQNLGVELLPLIAGLGIAGAGIALAMQGLLGNLLAGLTIILVKPFRVGEYIGIVGEEGTVDSITLFQTTLTHPDRSRVVIPNRKITGEILHNYGQIRQLEVSVGVAYDTDMNMALALVREVLNANPRVLQNFAPVIGVSMLADSSVHIAIKPWVAVTDFGPAAGEVNKAVLEAFRARGIRIPFPQREVRMLGAAA